MLPASDKSKRTHNPIRHIVDNLKPPVDHPKAMMNLALGDPTAHGNLLCPTVLEDAVIEAIRGKKMNGYLPSVGLPAARKAIAEYSTLPGFPVHEDDVAIASGCSGALELVLTGMLNEGDNLLVPQPGFPLYQVIAESLGGGVKQYALDATKNWECDVSHMESIIDSKTRAILICNPSNPCGSNYSAAHLEAVVAVARRHNLPIIADEIYGRCVFHGVHTPIHVVAGDVPVIQVGGIAKEFVVPGWRLGWLIFRDGSPDKRLTDIKNGIKSLTQLILGACSLIQGALPRLLTPAEGSADDVSLKEFHSYYMQVLRENASIAKNAGAECPQISVIVPEGAMYAMVGLDIAQLEGITDDADFAKQILTEENVFFLPGKVFGMDNFVRLVMCMPAAKMVEAFARIKLFCARRAIPAAGSVLLVPVDVKDQVMPIVLIYQYLFVCFACYFWKYMYIH
jgi:tyrosine aminotransferase